MRINLCKDNFNIHWKENCEDLIDFFALTRIDFITV